MNCAGIIRKLPEVEKQKCNDGKIRIVLPPYLYKECIKRWGKEEVEKEYIMDQKAKTT